MKRLSLILAVSAFAGMAGSAVAQAEPEGNVSDSERPGMDRTEEDRPRADLEKPEPTLSTEWLHSPPGLHRQVERFSVVTNPDQTHCATALGSAMNACLIAFGRCMDGVRNFDAFLRCADASILCIEAAEAAFDACLEEND